MIKARQKTFSNYLGSKFSGPRVKPALARRNVLFKTVLINTMPRDFIKSTAKPGLGQGLENDEHTCPTPGRRLAGGSGGRK